MVLESCPIFVCWSFFVPCVNSIRMLPTQLITSKLLFTTSSFHQLKIMFLFSLYTNYYFTLPNSKVQCIFYSFSWLFLLFQFVRKIFEYLIPITRIIIRAALLLSVQVKIYIIFIVLTISQFFLLFHDKYKYTYLYTVLILYRLFNIPLLLINLLQHCFLLSHTRLIRAQHT